MAITVADNFSYQGKKPLDGRDTFATLAAMKAYAEASVYDGCLSYCDEDGKRYEFKSTNTVDPTTGKWREYSSGGGGQTYNDFTGATASTAGAHGLVPAPSAGDEGKVLFGNGTWGNIVMPSVDLSNSSVESDILDTTEKAVGTTTDGYLIYQKVVSTGGSVPSGATLLMRVQLLNNTDIIRYTKTTDSPLPSGVKFAGVTSSGEVIYKKHYTGATPASPTRNWTTIESNFSPTKKYKKSEGTLTETATGSITTVNSSCGSDSVTSAVAVISGADLKIATQNVQAATYDIDVYYTLAS